MNLWILIQFGRQLLAWTIPIKFIALASAESFFANGNISADSSIVELVSKMNMM
jgi:hypothetical protein